MCEGLRTHQSGDPYPSLHSVPFVQADEHRRQRFQLTSQAEAADIDAWTAADVPREVGDDGLGRGIVAADEYVILQVALGVPQIDCRYMVDGADDLGSWNDLLGLLSRAAVVGDP
jgi:hypothetical protein